MLCNFDMLCNFVLTLYKKLTFYKDLNKKTICKSSTVLSWICKKHAFRDFLSFSKKKISLIKKSVEQLKNKENVIIKKGNYESFSTMYNHSIRQVFLELSINKTLSPIA